MDVTGTIRFLDEVPSGLACGCFCIVCSGNLIARKGEINEWHFSHESGTQRPECLAGARNLIRRYVEDFLTQPQTKICPADFRTRATHEQASFPAVWNAAVCAIDDWRDKPGPNKPAATVRLERGYVADLYIVIGDETHQPSLRSHDRGSLIAKVDMPDVLFLRSKEHLFSHIAASISFQWTSLPDVHGVLAAAQEQARQIFLAQQRAQAEAQLAAGRRWAQIRRRAANASSEWSPVDRVEAEVAPVAQAVAPAPLWAKDLSPHSSIFVYRFRDGSRWILLNTRTNGHLLRPWPLDEEGWDEALPASIGIADADLGGYRVASYLHLLQVIPNYFVAMRNTSDPNEVETLIRLIG